jgi:hypothetical protein
VRPGNTNACVRYPVNSSKWYCYHTTAGGGGNGWFLSTAAYEPVTVLNDMRQLVENATATQIAISRSTVAGVPVKCLAVTSKNVTNGVAGNVTTSACITAGGVLASFSTPPQTGYLGGDFLLYGTATSILKDVQEARWAIPAKPQSWAPAGPSCELVRGCGYEPVRASGTPSA